MVGMFGATAIRNQEKQIGKHASKLVFFGPNID